jgi:glutaredoxin
MKKVFLVLSLSFIVFQLCLVPVVSAKLYTWIDKNGLTRRTYYPPPSNQVRKGNQAQKASSSQKRSKNQVELYVTSWCPYCKQAKDFFRSKGVKIKVYDIEKDKKAAARKKKLDGPGKGVPFAVVNGKYISGFAPTQYSNALK